MLDLFAFVKGIEFFFNLLLDVFVDYLYQPVHFSTRIDIGGFKIGAGIGYKFPHPD